MTMMLRTGGIIITSSNRMASMGARMDRVMVDLKALMEVMVMRRTRTMRKMMEMVMKRMAIKKMVKPWTLKTLDLLVLFFFFHEVGPSSSSQEAAFVSLLMLVIRKMVILHSLTAELCSTEGEEEEEEDDEEEEDTMQTFSAARLDGWCLLQTS
jgi:hypothetical protein